MSTSTEPRPAKRELPDLDAEREVDLRRHWDTITTYWWLPLAGFVGGIVIGLLISLGGKQVYTAKATIYLGQPLSPSGGAQIQGLQTNPSTVGVIVHGEPALREAAKAAGMPVGQLRGHVSYMSVSGSLSKLGQTPLVQLTVTGNSPRKIQLATNALARIVIKNTSHPVDLKIATLKAELEGQTQALGSIDKIVAQLRTAASSQGLSTIERLIVASQLNAQTLQRSQVVDSQALTRQLLSVAQGVEHGQIINTAVPTKTTARSRRNTVIVAALIGLLLGIVAALLWEPITRVVRRSA